MFVPHSVYTKILIYGKLRKNVGIILRRLCEYKEVEIIEANACIDHIHMLVKIPPKLSLSCIDDFWNGGKYATL